MTKRKIIYQEQLTPYDCGLACIRMIAEYLGINCKNLTPLPFGSKASIRFLSEKLNELKIENHPFYAEIKQQPPEGLYIFVITKSAALHYVLVEINSKDNVIVYDPEKGKGVSSISFNELKEQWNGYTIFINDKKNES